MTNRIPVPVFAHAGDLLVASVGESAFAFMPGRTGHYFAYGSGIDRPMSAWRPDDFYGHGGPLATEDAFRAAVLEQHRHQVERDRLGRITETVVASTPWGMAQSTTIYGPGIRKHATASHGGFELDHDRNRHVHEALRTGGWYEEDCAWAAVAVAFPELFTTYERRQAERTIRHSMPEAWEAIHGRPLQVGESDERDRLRVRSTEPASYDHAAEFWSVGRP